MKPVLIVGAGLAGLSCALRLRQLSPQLSITLFEKTQNAHHKVCGEYMSYESEILLRELGLPLEELGAVPMQNGHVHGPNQVFHFNLPHRAWGISRKVLDETLIHLCEKNNIQVIRETVMDVRPKSHPDQDGCTSYELLRDSVALDDDVQVVLANGKRDLAHGRKRKLLGEQWVGYKFHIRSPLPSMPQSLNQIQLFNFELGYFGVSPVSHRTLNICGAFRIGREGLPKLKDFPDWVLEKNLTGLKDLDRTWTVDQESLCAVSPVPYGYVEDAKESPFSKQFFLVGDQLSCIPSFCGDGMSLALATGSRCAEFIIRGDSPSFFNQWASKKVRSQISWGLRIQSVQGHPFWLDSTLNVVQKFPFLFRWLHQKTRCESLLNSTINPIE